jgi:hypothetical protein
MAERKVVLFDEFYYQLKLTHLFQKHPVCTVVRCVAVLTSAIWAEGPQFDSTSISTFLVNVFVQRNASVV